MGTSSTKRLRILEDVTDTREYSTEEKCVRTTQQIDENHVDYIYKYIFVSRSGGVKGTLLINFFLLVFYVYGFLFSK